MKNILVVVDMQKDFVDGALGSAEACAIVPAAARKIAAFEGDIFVTYDTHFENYMDTAEGKKLPVPHCIKGTEGWELNKDIAAALEGKKYTPVEKNTFGSVDLPKLIKKQSAMRNSLLSSSVSAPIYVLSAMLCSSRQTSPRLPYPLTQPAVQELHPLSTMQLSRPCEAAR